MLCAISKAVSERCVICDDYYYNGYQDLKTGDEICFCCGELILQSLEHTLDERIAS